MMRSKGRDDFMGGDEPAVTEGSQVVSKGGSAGLHLHRDQNRHDRDENYLLFTY